MPAPKPEGWHSVTPRLVVNDVPAMVEFLMRAFDATGELETERPSVMRIGDSNVMISGSGVRQAMESFLYLYVDDCDQTYGRALEAGAESLEKPRDVPYGERRAMVRDPAGNVWQIATYGGDSQAPASQSVTRSADTRFQAGYAGVPAAVEGG